MFYRFIARQGPPASEFLKTQLWPLASRPALISSERFYPASRVYNIRPILHSACFPSWVDVDCGGGRNVELRSRHTRGHASYMGGEGGQIDGGAPLAWLGLTSG